MRMSSQEEKDMCDNELWNGAHFLLSIVVISNPSGTEFSIC
jgi:hypothetical protein